MFTTTSEVVKILLIIWLLTIGRSIIIMLGGSKLFDKALKGSKTAYIPIINLFVMLEIADVSTFFGILLFVPCVNVFVLLLMSYKIGKVFEKDFLFTLGLMFLPIFFYPILFRSNLKYKYGDENYFLALDSAKAESVNLMTQDEINELNNTPDPVEPIVDSIFKTELEMMEPVETYKASRLNSEELNKMDNLTYDDYQFAPIERIDPESVHYEDTSEEETTKNGSVFLTELDKDDEIEIVDL